MTDSEKLDFLVEAVARQDKKMDALEKSLKEVRSELKEDIQEVRSELKEEIQEVRSGLKEEIQKVQDDVTSVKLIMENELRRNISIVAENHLDLYEKLSEYQKVAAEQLHLSMRVNTLESYMKELRKERTA